MDETYLNSVDFFTLASSLSPSLLFARAWGKFRLFSVFRSLGLFDVWTAAQTEEVGSQSLALKLRNAL